MKEETEEHMTEETEKNEDDIEEKIDDIAEDTGERLEEKIQELESSLKRVMADFDNYRKRINSEKKRIIELANENLVYDVLPVIDDLERALEGGDIPDKEGLDMILRKLKNTLKEHGLEKIEVDGKEFDPYCHDCIFSEEVQDEDKNDMVLEEIQKGYRLKSNVIRPAKVKVGKYSAKEKEVDKDEQ